jgi:peptidoglycan/xylan/chitin deacetylase (PgdA/CDA1 family)
MKSITLGYHDVVEDGSLPVDVLRKAPGHYALERTSFQEHLLAIRRRTSATSVQTIEKAPTSAEQVPVFLTFDDGALGADTCAADELERLGWRGHFFIITEWIGSLGFLNAREIRELRKRGHVIGSHSHSHPSRMSHLDPPALWREWSKSCQVLSDVLGEPVTTGSIPNGYYSRHVAEMAAQVGIKALFTSEPRTSSMMVNGCMIVGRYAVMAQTPASEAGAIAAGDVAPRLIQAASWKAKKTAKAIGGNAYLKLRGAVLNQLRA